MTRKILILILLLATLAVWWANCTARRPVKLDERQRRDFI
jgi:hypothetical protein